MREISASDLREAVLERLRLQGYSVGSDGRIEPPPLGDKAAIRALHAHAVETRRARAGRTMARYEPALLEHIANGDEVEPSRIRPVLEPVVTEAQAILFRYATLHWSLPVSCGYGRRMRFLVRDGSNGKLMGVIGLTDAMWNIGVRDRWIGWSPEAKHARLRYVVDAFVLGAVPPYASLLCGKFVAMASCCTETRRAWADAKGLPYALLTTTSAFGRSAIYNRLKYRDRWVMRSIGYTQGWGVFHFPDDLYESILAYARARWGKPKSRWGCRMEVCRRVLEDIGLSGDLLRHSVPREMFVAPQGANAVEFLRGETDEFTPYPETLSDMWAFFHTRWLQPRMDRTNWRAFRRDEWRLWT